MAKILDERFNFMVTIKKKKFPSLTEEEIAEVLESDPVNYALQVRAALKMLAESMDSVQAWIEEHNEK